MSVAASMAPIAGQQHGLFHVRQTHAQAVTSDALAWARKTGEVERVLPEVYAIAGVPRTWRFAVMAAVLDGGPDAVASHRTAAALLGTASRAAPRLVEITLPRSKSSRSPGAIVHRSGDLNVEHVMVIDGIPCAGPLRTLVDLGSVEPWWEVRDALERALQGGQCTILGCEWMLARLSERGRSGCGVFRRVLDERALKVV